MEKKLYLTFIIIFFTSLVHGQQGFELTYGGMSDDYGHSVKSLPDGGFIVAGRSFSFSSSMDDAYIIRTDATGGISWSRNFGRSHQDAFFRAIPTSDGGFIACGYSDAANYLQETYLVKLDASGNQSWTKAVSLSSVSVLHDIVQTDDLGYAATGTISDSTENDIIFIRYNYQGDTLYTVRHGSIGTEKSYAITESKDAGFLIAGETTVESTTQQDAYLVKLDALGNEMWTREFGAGYQDAFYSVNALDDGTIILAGYTETAPGNRDALLVLADSSGNMIWSRTFGDAGNETFKKVLPVKDGGFIMTGSTTSYGSGQEDVYLVKVDPTGKLEWYRTFGGDQDDFGESMDKTTDDGWVLVGSTKSHGESDTQRAFEIYLIKTDALGLVTGLPETFAANADIRVFPTLARENVNFEFDEMQSGSGWKVDLFDQQGRKVAQAQTNSPKLTMNREGLSSGIYFYRVMKEKEILKTGKIIFD